MSPEIRRTPQPGAVIAVFAGEMRSAPTYVARCPCGWNAVTSATEAPRAEADLRELVRAHRATCTLLSRES